MNRAIASESNALPDFLERFEARKIVRVPRDGIVFHQGDSANALFYLIHGQIRYSVNTASGKDAMLFVFSEGDFFGERCLTERARRFGTACALTDSVILRLDKKEVESRIQQDPAFGDFLFNKMLDRAHEYEEVLLLHLVNKTELRLAAVLLRLAGFYRTHQKSLTPVRGISQSQLAEMVGTTRPRINIFMNKFRRSGLISYKDDEILVKSGLVRLVAISDR